MILNMMLKQEVEKISLDDNEIFNYEKFIIWFNKKHKKDDINDILKMTKIIINWFNHLKINFTHHDEMRMYNLIKTKMRCEHS